MAFIEKGKKIFNSSCGSRLSLNSKKKNTNISRKLRRMTDK